MGLSLSGLVHAGFDAATGNFSGAAGDLKDVAGAAFQKADPNKQPGETAVTDPARLVIPFSNPNAPTGEQFYAALLMCDSGLLSSLQMAWENDSVRVYSPTGNGKNKVAVPFAVAIKRPDWLAWAIWTGAAKGGGKQHSNDDVLLSVGNTIMQQYGGGNSAGKIVTTPKTSAQKLLDSVKNASGKFVENVENDVVADASRAVQDAARPAVNQQLKKVAAQNQTPLLIGLGAGVAAVLVVLGVMHAGRR